MNSSPKITSVAPISADDWRDVCKACAYATYFHTPEWAALWHTYSGGRMHRKPVLVRFDDGFSAVLPLLEYRRLGGLLCIGHSSAGGTYGGWISTDPLDNRHAAALAGLLRARSMYWRENPYDPLLGAIDLPGAKEDFCQVVDLRVPYQTIYDGADRAHHKAMRKAERDGVVIRPAQSDADWDAYYGVYQDSLARWKSGGPEKQSHMIYRRDFFTELRTMAGAGTNIRLWLALNGSTVIAGIVCLYWNHHCVTWHGAALGDYFAMRPNNLLYWTIMRDAQDAGYWWFDLNPSGGYRGVEEFKEFMGARKMRSRTIEVHRGLARLVLPAAAWLRKRRDGK